MKLETFLNLNLHVPVLFVLTPCLVPCEEKILTSISKVLLFIYYKTKRAETIQIVDVTKYVCFY